MKDFADLYSPAKYFPVDGEPDLESFGADAYMLCGQFNSNLALLTRTPMLNKRLLGGEKSTKVSLEAALRKQTQGILANGPEGEQFIKELTHLLQDYHDYQSSVRAIARGKLFSSITLVEQKKMCVKTFIFILRVHHFQFIHWEMCPQYL